MKKCPYCAEEIQGEAIKCKHCGEFLDKKPQDKWYFKNPSLIIAFLCVGPFALPLVWFNPNLSQIKKIVISIIIIVVSYLCVIFLKSSFESMKMGVKSARFGEVRGITCFRLLLR